MKISIYIDGSNFYFSVKKAFGCKLDIEKFCKKLIKEKELIQINYYISPIGESDPKKYIEQQRFLEKLKKINKFKVVFGRLEKRKRDGEEYYVEKATDVNLALDLVLDAQKGIYDEAYLISNDGDFSEAVKSAINFGKKVIYVAIGNRKSISHHLKRVSSKALYISKEFISDCKL